MYGAGGGPFPFGQGMGEGPRGGGGVWREPGLRPGPAKLGRRPAAPACGRARCARPPPPPGPFAHMAPMDFTFCR